MCMHVWQQGLTGCWGHKCLNCPQMTRKPQSVPDTQMKKHLQVLGAPTHHPKPVSLALCLEMSASDSCALHLQAERCLRFSTLFTVEFGYFLAYMHSVFWGFTVILDFCWKQLSKFYPSRSFNSQPQDTGLLPGLIQGPVTGNLFLPGPVPGAVPGTSLLTWIGQQSPSRSTLQETPQKRWVLLSILGFTSTPSSLY